MNTKTIKQNLDNNEDILIEKLEKTFNEEQKKLFHKILELEYLKSQLDD